MEQKKPTKQQLESKIKKSLVFVERDKDYKVIYFNDKGLKLEVTHDCAIVSTNYHKHVFEAFTASGMSKPYIYIGAFIDLAIKHIDDIMVTADGDTYVSYGKLNSLLKNKKDKTDAENLEYATFFYVDMWLYNIFTPLYEIGEFEATQFMTFLHYVENIVRHRIQLEEHKEDMTNKQFANKVIDEVIDIMRTIDERVIYHKMTDEEFAQKELEAAQQTQIEREIETQMAMQKEKEEMKDETSAGESKETE